MSNETTRRNAEGRRNRKVAEIEQEPVASPPAVDEDAAAFLQEAAEAAAAAALEAEALATEIDDDAPAPAPAPEAEALVAGSAETLETLETLERAREPNVAGSAYFSSMTTSRSTSIERSLCCAKSLLRMRHCPGSHRSVSTF